MSSTNRRFDIALVIPAYQEGTRLPRFLTHLVAEASRHVAPRIDFIVSDDGSAPDSARLEEEAAQAAQRQIESLGLPHRFRFVRSEVNQGKGSAIRRGWAEATADAEWFGFLDADGSVSASEVFRIATQIETFGAEGVAASRVKMAGRRIERRLFRHLQGRVFATLIEQFFELGFYDTQCGFKLFRASWLRPLLPKLVEEGFLIDVEVLALLKLCGARFVEVPVDWIDDTDSRVRFGIDAIRMFLAMHRVSTRVDALISEIEPLRKSFPARVTMQPLLPTAAIRTTSQH